MNININIPVGHMTGDRDNTNFYYFFGGVMKVSKRGSPYNVVATYPVNTYVGTVSCIQFDGYYYWSLEKQTNGYIIKKWELSSGILYQRAIFSYTSSAALRLDVDSFVVDSYNSTLDGYTTSGVTTIKVKNSSYFKIGDVVVIGTVIVNESRSIVSKNDITNELYLDSPTINAYVNESGVYTSRYFFVFNKYSFYDQNSGSLLRYSCSNGSFVSYASSSVFADVKATCFYSGKILFVKGNEVIQYTVNPASVVLFRRTTINNLDTTRADIVPIYSIWLYSDVLYRLQNKRVYYTSEIKEWEEEDWGDYYNYISETFPTVFVSTVYFVEIKAYPMMVHAVSLPSVPTASVDVTVTVLNQDRTPLSGITVTLTSTKGTMVPSSGATDSNGRFTSVYNGTSYIGEVEITATAG
jgi:hypothetical protein